MGRFISFAPPAHYAHETVNGASQLTAVCNPRETPITERVSIGFLNVLPQI